MLFLDSLLVIRPRSSNTPARAPHRALPVSADAAADPAMPSPQAKPDLVKIDPVLGAKRFSNYLCAFLPA